MSKKNNGICRLCLEEKELCNSHIIPEFAYKYVYDESKGGRKISYFRPSESNDLIITNNQKGYREYLLCFKCEGNFFIFDQSISYKNIVFFIGILN